MKKKTPLILLALTLSLSAFATSPDRVIGSDSRVRISSKNHKPIHDSIGLLIITDAENKKGYCTGTVISSNHVLTAAHCIVSNSKFVKSVEFIPGHNGPVGKTQHPYGSFKAIQFQAMKNYFTSEKTIDDLGLVKFAENLPVPPVELAVAPTTTVLFNKLVGLTIAGYPGDKVMGTLWEGKGYRYTNLLGNNPLSHNVDTAPGQSGSAVRTTINGVEKIIGVHSSGLKGFLVDYNEALFFDKATISALKKWMEK